MPVFQYSNEKRDKIIHKDQPKTSIQIMQQKIIINESTLIPFSKNNPHQVYICNLDIDFDGPLGMDFLEHYECIVDLRNRQLITNVKTVQL